MNGSPKTSVNTAVNTVLKHPPGKTRVYLQKTGYTREIPESASMPRAPYSQGPCATCGAHRLLKYAHRTMCARYKCQKRHGLQVAVRTMRSCRHSASSATLGRGLHRRVDPLAERPQGALAAHAAGYASRQGLPQKYSPSSGIHTISHTTHECTSSLHCLQLCAAAFWCSKTSLHAAQAHGPSLPFIALRPVSAHRPASAWACGRRDNSVDSGNSRHSPASNGACQHLPRGGVNTFEHLYGCGVNR